MMSDARKIFFIIFGSISLVALSGCAKSGGDVAQKWIDNPRLSAQSIANHLKSDGYCNVLPISTIKPEPGRDIATCFLSTSPKLTKDGLSNDKNNNLIFAMSIAVGKHLSEFPLPDPETGQMVYHDAKSVDTIYGSNWSISFTTLAIAHPESTNKARNAMSEIAKKYNGQISRNYTPRDWCDSVGQFIDLDKNMKKEYSQCQVAFPKFGNFSKLSWKDSKK